MTEFELKFKEKTGYEFNKYYKDYKPKLTWYLTRYTKNIETAEEFANMAFVQGLEKIDTYNNELSQFITWLTSIAVNLVIKDFKDRKKKNQVSLDDEISDNFKILNSIGYEDNIEEKELEYENKAKCEIIKDVISTLPDKYKTVMVMRELECKPYKEIAETIKKTYNVNLTYDDYDFTSDDFYCMDITNNGNDNIDVNFYNDDIYSITYSISPSERKIINKSDIDNINIDEGKIKISSKKSKADVKYTKTTNLSTIKSQIKKGRFLIRKKVKKKFETIDKNGVL